MAFDAMRGRKKKRRRRKKEVGKKTWKEAIHESRSEKRAVIDKWFWLRFDFLFHFLKKKLTTFQNY
jgi:hypothetical protein